MMVHISTQLLYENLHLKLFNCSNCFLSTVVHLLQYNSIMPECKCANFV